jgi:hypothetical protein
MKGNGLFNVMDSNNFAVNPQQNFGKWASSQGKLCWKCQQNKPRKGGSEKLLAGFSSGLRRFICQDCIEAKQRSIAACQDPSPPNP